MPKSAREIISQEAIEGLIKENTYITKAGEESLLLSASLSKEQLTALRFILKENERLQKQLEKDNV